MERIVELIRKKARAKLKTIALPEYNDQRVIEAAEFIEKEGLAKVLLLTPDKINTQQKERYIEDFFHLRQDKGVDIHSARQLFTDPLYYAIMLTREGRVDGFVAGASHTTPDVARAAIQVLGIDERLCLACSCFIMAVPNSCYGENGTFVFADCGIVPEPTCRQLACISIAAAELAWKVLDFTPRVALLSYSTKGSAKGKHIEKVLEALRLAKEMAPDLLIDGEMQVDAAIVPEVAKIKCLQSPLGGRANVLIFPNLEAGNIGYKLLNRLGSARAIGPLLLGLRKPCSDLSRGCSVEDIVDCAAITAIRAQ